MKSKELVVNIYRKYYSLKGSIVSDGSFTKSEIRAMVENWLQVEDDSDAIVGGVDESIEML